MICIIESYFKIQRIPDKIEAKGSEILAPYWANSSSNGLAGKLSREGGRRTKQEFEQLLCGRTITVEIHEQIVYNQLSTTYNAIRSLLLASGYLKVVSTPLKYDFVNLDSTVNDELLKIIQTEGKIIYEKV